MLIIEHKASNRFENLDPPPVQQVYGHGVRRQLDRSADDEVEVVVAPEVTRVEGEAVVHAAVHEPGD